MTTANLFACFHHHRGVTYTAEKINGVQHLSKKKGGGGPSRAIFLSIVQGRLQRQCQNVHVGGTHLAGGGERRLLNGRLGGLRRIGGGAGLLLLAPLEAKAMSKTGAAVISCPSICPVEQYTVKINTHDYAQWTGRILHIVSSESQGEKYVHI
jgi:hypothetical protein